MRGAAKGMPKHAPEALQNPARHPPKPSKIEARATPGRQNAPKTCPRAARRHPGAPKIRPRSAQELPRGRPRAAKRCPRRAQEAPEPHQKRVRRGPQAQIYQFYDRSARRSVRQASKLDFWSIVAHGVTARTLNFIAPVDVFNGFSRMDVFRAMSA